MNPPRDPAQDGAGGSGRAEGLVWLLLVGLVGASALIRSHLASLFPAPWVFFDELVYSELAKGLAAVGELRLRDVPVEGYSPGYPLLLSIAYRLSDDIKIVYSTAKTIDSVVMSLAAIPAYLLARFVLDRWRSLAVAVFAVAVPALLYTCALLTENLFYPVFLTAVLAFLHALWRPTTTRQLLALAAFGATYLVRTQAIAMIPALASTILVLCWLEARRAGAGRMDGLRRSLGRYKVIWIALAVLLVLPPLVKLVRGEELAELLGRYRYVLGAGALDRYEITGIARAFAIHLGELGFSAGVAPLACLLLLLVRSVRTGEAGRERVFAVLAAALLVWFVLVVSTFGHVLDRPTVKERNLFFIVPCLFVALLWATRAETRFRERLIAASAACLLPCLIPFDAYLGPGTTTDTLALFPLWEIEQGQRLAGLGLELGVATSLLAGVLFALSFRRFLVAGLAVGILATLIAIQVPLYRRTSEMSALSLAAGIGAHPTWIDAVLPAGATVTALWTKTSNPQTIWQNEFFNRSLHTVAYLQDPLVDVLPQRKLKVDGATGLLRGENGEPAFAQYVLSRRTTVLDGVVVADDKLHGMRLRRVDGPLILREHATGLYPDSWSEPEFWYLRTNCPEGRLTFHLTSDPNLRVGPQMVRAFIGDRPVGTLTFRGRERHKQLEIAVPPGGGSCVVRFEVTPSVVPALVLGTADHRTLGVRVPEITFTPTTD